MSVCTLPGVLLLNHYAGLVRHALSHAICTTYCTYSGVLRVGTYGRLGLQGGVGLVYTIYLTVRTVVMYVVGM